MEKLEKELKLEDSSIFQARIREEDLKPEEALQNIQDKIDELAKDQLLEDAQGLREEQGVFSLEEEVYRGTDEDFASLLHDVTMFAEESNALSLYEVFLEKICSLFEYALEYVVRPSVTEKKSGWLFSLLKKFFDKRLSWEETIYVLCYNLLCNMEGI